MNHKESCPEHPNYLKYMTDRHPYGFIDLGRGECNCMNEKIPELVPPYREASGSAGMVDPVEMYKRGLEASKLHSQQQIERLDKLIKLINDSGSVREFIRLDRIRGL